MDVLFILHADHEQNCSTNAMRGVGSSHVDPYSAIAGAAAALYGPLHGGANEAVLRMLNEIGSIDRIPDFIRRVKAGEGRLMGFGHRVYKNYDPRARIIKKMAYEVFEVTGRTRSSRWRWNWKESRGDEYFIKRKLYPMSIFIGSDLPGHGVPDCNIPGVVCHRPHSRMDRTVD